MFIHQNEGDEMIPSSWLTLSRPVQPDDSEVNRIDEKTNYAGRSDSAKNERTDRDFEGCSTEKEFKASSSDSTEECIGGVCALRWSPEKPHQQRDVA